MYLFVFFPPMRGDSIIQREWTRCYIFFLLRIFIVYYLIIQKKSKCMQSALDIYFIPILRNYVPVMDHLLLSNESNWIIYFFFSFLY